MDLSRPHHLCAFQAGPGPVSEPREHGRAKKAELTHDASDTGTKKHTPKNTKQSKQVLTAFDATLKVTGDKWGNQYIYICIWCICFICLLFWDSDVQSDFYLFPSAIPKLYKSIANCWWIPCEFQVAQGHFGKIRVLNCHESDGGLR